MMIFKNSCCFVLSSCYVTHLWVNPVCTFLTASAWRMSGGSEKLWLLLMCFPVMCGPWAVFCTSSAPCGTRYSPWLHVPLIWLVLPPNALSLNKILILLWYIVILQKICGRMKEVQSSPNRLSDAYLSACCHGEPHSSLLCPVSGIQLEEPDS